MADIPSGRRENLNETKTVTGDVIVPGGVLLGVGYKECAADVLNIERREAVWNFLGNESFFAQIHALEVGVIDFDFRGAEIRDIKKFVAIDFAGGCAFVDGAIRGAVIGVIDDEDGVLSAVPAGDRSIFCGKDEVSGLAGSNQKIGRAAIEHDTCGSRLGSCRRAHRGRNGDVASAINGNGGARARVESGSAGIVVGDPPGAAAGERVSPQGFFRLGSGGFGVEIEARFETRLVCL